MFTLQGLFVYPVKSLAGIALREAEVQASGLQYDRQWMLVDERGVFVSQREIPEMALLGTALEAPLLTVFSRKNPEIRLQIPLEAPESELEPIEVQIWNDVCAARAYGTPYNRWFSEQLGFRLRLVFLPDSTRRRTDGQYADSTVRFADGFPYLLIGQASLDALNGRLAQPLPMNRFRPNFVFGGGTPFEEDEWHTFRIGSQLFRCVKPCARCTIITIDQGNAGRSTEPLHTLSQFRRAGQKVLFGQNTVWLGGSGAATVRTGDTVVRLT